METEKVFNRKRELIIRDPIFEDLSNVFNRIEDFSWIRNLADYGQFIELWGETIDKWHVALNFDYLKRNIFIKPYFTNNVIWVGRKYSGIDFDTSPRLQWTCYPNPFNDKPFCADINELVDPEPLGQSLHGKRIALVIDTSYLNKNDARKIKKLLWKTIEPYLEKGVSKAPRWEHPECAFLYSLRREDTFQNYLRWYDIHTKEKLSFRLIAHIDKIHKTDPGKASEILEKLKSQKIRWGNPIKGEDKIEKGVKLIYKAIHGKKYSQKKIKPLIEEYNCPQHRSDCPASCKYYKDWLGRFNRLMPSI